MEQSKYRLKDFADAVSTAVQDPQSTFYNKFVGLEHYDSGEPVVTRYQSTDLLTSACKEFHKNDILIARRNVYLKRAGIVFFDGLTSGDSIVLRVYQDLEDRIGIPYDDAVRILPFVLNSNAFWAYANRHADGMNSKRISKEKVLDYEFTLPPLSEQKRLAEKLWAAYEVKQSYKNMIAATDEMVKSQFIEMFYNDKYSLQKLNGHIDVLRGVSYKPIDVTDSLSSSVSVILRSNNIDDGQINYDDLVFVKSERVSDVQVVTAGDIIMCGSNGSKKLVGKAAMIETEPKHRTSFGAFCLGLRCKDTINPKYLATYLQTSKYRSVIESLSSGSNILNIKPDHINNLEIPIPEIKEQMKFVTIAEQADKSKQELHKSIESIDKVIKSLINENL